LVSTFPFSPAFKLPPILRSIKMPLRLRNQSILSELPYLVAAEPNPVPGASRPGVGAHKCPAVNGAISPDADVVHRQLHIRKRAHESLRHFCDGAAPNVR